MTQPLLPPQYVNVPSSLAYGDLPKSVIVSGLRIVGLGWRYHYTRTDPIGTVDLCAVCGINRSQLYDHLAQLLAAKVFQYTSTAGRFTFTFQQNNPSPVFRTDPALGAAVDSEKQHQQYSHGFQGGCGGDSVQSGKPDWGQRLAALDRIGVREPARTEIAGLEYATAEYLDAWATWFGSQSKCGVGMLIGQLRAGVPAPESQRDYISGEYAQYIQH